MPETRSRPRPRAGARRRKLAAASSAKSIRRLPPTTRRMARHTAEEVNRRIAERTRASIEWHAAHPDRIDRRLHELDAEWDMERLLETNASALAFFGTVLGVAANRRWLLLPALVGGFLFQHAVQGWCPPVPAFRRLGVRTAREIAQERYALKALRGDFDGLPHAKNGAAKEADMQAEAAMKAVHL